MNESPSLPRWLELLFLGLTIIGLADASYLEASHIAGYVPFCTIANGCNAVLASSYADIAGIPVAVFGVAYYAVLFLLTLLYLGKGRVAFLRAAAWMTIIGLITSAVLVYLQLGVLHTICEFCMLSAITSTLLFITGMRIVKRTGRKHTVPTSDEARDQTTKQE